MNPTHKNESSSGDRNSTDRVHFEDFEIDLGARTLRRHGERIHIQRKPLEVLIHLARSAPRMVPRDELLEMFWSGAVNEEVLTRCISTIRKALEDTMDPPRFIETHRGAGYRFLAGPHPAPETATVSRPPWPRAASYPIGVAALAAIIGVAIGFSSWTSGPDDRRINRIAVMHMSVPANEPDWLAVAMTENLTHTVSRIEGITVVAPGSMDAARALTEGRLNVDAVLTSHFERREDGSSITAHLKAAPDGELLWSTRVESPEQFGSREQVANLSRKVAVRLRPTLQLRRPERPVDPAAYRHYLEGRYFLGQRSSESLHDAIEAFEAALVIDAEYADAMVSTAEAWLVLPLYGATRPNESIPRARQLAERALATDPENAGAMAVLGAIAMQFDWDWRNAERLLHDSITRNPNSARAHQWLGEVFCYQGRAAECRHQFETALDLDPLSPVLRMQRGSVHFYAGEYQAALKAWSAAARENPSFSLGRYVVGLAHAGLGEWRRAVEAYESTLPELGLEITGGPLVYALAKDGRRERARAVLRDLETLAEERYVPPSKLAIAYLGLGDDARARAAFVDAIEAHDDRMVYFATDVHTRDLGRDPQYLEILQRIGLESVVSGSPPATASPDAPTASRERPKATKP